MQIMHNFIDLLVYYDVVDNAPTVTEWLPWGFAGWPALINQSNMLETNI